MLDLPLSFLHRPADSASAAPWLLVLMHGVGSNEEDLFGLAPYVPAQFHAVCHGAGCLRLVRIHGEPGGRPHHQRATRGRQPRHRGKNRGLSRTATGHSTRAYGRRRLQPGRHHGASLLLTQPALLQAAMVLHSRLLTQVLPLVAAPEALKGKQLWLSHGTRDQVIPLAAAHVIRELVKTMPIELVYAEYPSAHEIIQEELGAAMGWLQRLAL